MGHLLYFKLVYAEEAVPLVTILEGKGGKIS